MVYVWIILYFCKVWWPPEAHSINIHLYMRTSIRLMKTSNGTFVDEEAVSTSGLCGDIGDETGEMWSRLLMETFISARDVWSWTSKTIWKYLWCFSTFTKLSKHSSNINTGYCAHYMVFYTTKAFALYLHCLINLNPIYGIYSIIWTHIRNY